MVQGTTESSWTFVLFGHIDTPPPQKAMELTIIILCVVLGLLVFLVILLSFVLCVCRRRAQQAMNPADNEQLMRDLNNQEISNSYGFPPHDIHEDRRNESIKKRNGVTDRLEITPALNSSHTTSTSANGDPQPTKDPLQATQTSGLGATYAEVQTRKPSAEATDASYAVHVKSPKTLPINAQSTTADKNETDKKNDRDKEKSKPNGDGVAYAELEIACASRKQREIAPIDNNDQTVGKTSGNDAPKHKNVEGLVYADLNLTKSEQTSPVVRKDQPVVYAEITRKEK